MNHRFFPLDKNYILKEAQSNLKQPLMKAMFEHVKAAYLLQCNPLGLEDDNIIRIKNYEELYPVVFSDFYDSIAGIYRYKYGSNQLELLFDGKTHLERYTEDWEKQYKLWIAEFCQEYRFLKAVLKLTVFRENYNIEYAEKRLQIFLVTRFSLKLGRKKGHMALLQP